MGNITIVPMGYSDVNGLSVGAYKFLFGGNISDKKIILRTERHLVFEEMKNHGIAVETLDRFYDESESFEDMYDSMYDYIMKYACECDVVLCVPGAPTVGDILVKRLVDAENVDVNIISGVGIMDRLSEIGNIVSDGVVSVCPAHLIKKSMINTRAYMYITEVDNKLLASEIKIMLQDKYPEDIEIMYFYGYPEMKCEKIFLYELDRQKKYDFSVNFAIFPLDNFAKKLYDIEALFEIMRILRGLPVESGVGALKYDQMGCAWDRVQTHESIRQNMIEEAYEVVEAINKNDIENLVEELGDMLLQVVFHSQIAAETGEFTFSDVVSCISEKLVRRHPHVFGDVVASDSDGAYAAWENIKATEKKNSSVSASLTSLPKDLPPFTTALKVLKKTEKSGYVPSYSDAAKLVSRCFEDILTADNSGELLVAITDVLRKKEINPDIEIKKYIDEYVKKFSDWESE